MFLQTFEPLPTSLFDNAVMYFKFDESISVVLDSTNNLINGFETNVTRGVSGIISNSYSFNGTSSFVTVPNRQLLNISDGISDSNFTLRFWVNLNNNNDQVFANKVSENNASDLEWNVRIINGKVRLGVYDSTSNANSNYRFVNSNNNVDLTGGWHQLVFTYDGTNYKIYKNGLEIPTTTDQNGTYNCMGAFNADLTIGKNAFNNSAYVDGLIDEFCFIINESWDSEQVLQDYNSGDGTTITQSDNIYNLFDNSVAYYKLEQTTNAYLDSAKSNDSIEVGSSLVRGVSGIINNGVESNGLINDYIKIQSSTDFDFTNGTNDLSFTFRGWYKTNNNTSLQTFFSRAENNQVQILFRLDQGKLSLRLYNDLINPNNNRKTYTSVENVNFQTSNYNHIVVTYDGQNALFYLNTFNIPLEESIQGTYNSMKISTSNIEIGRNNFNSAQSWNGDYDEICFIKNESWTAQQVLQDYNFGNGTTINGVFDIILIAGQSNADGRVNINDTNTPYYISSGILKNLDGSNILSFNNTLLTDFDFSASGPNGTGKEWVQSDNTNQWSFSHVASSLIESNGNSKIIVCQVTQGRTQLSPLPIQNSNIGSWSTDFDNVVGFKMLEALESKFNNLVSYLNSQNISYNVKSLIWHQGENDYLVSINPNLSLSQRQSALDNYQTDFESLISYVRAFTNKPNLPIVYGTVPSSSNWYSAEIRNAQLAVASNDNNAYCRDNNDLNLFDGLHFDAASNITFGLWASEIVLQ